MSLDLPANVTIGPDHIWCQLFETANRFTTPGPALFLDRDGVIVEEMHYLHKPEEVALIDGAASLIAKANAKDMPVVIVTNQAGVARDMFGWVEFAAVQQRMLDLLMVENGAFVDAVYACPYHKSGIDPFRHPDHEARKPNPGMLTRAMDAIAIEKQGSLIIGDKAGDLKAGLNAGITAGMHVLTGHGSDDGEREKADRLASKDFQVHLADSIRDALDLL
ncbi:HAD-IIIA family hydrolase [Terasakiella sp. A23]|uniref:D-glycero-alpha-D-manno-heptose-1,7-bisphosphate 7-phosphatase n=1 Tax=Terasakiella sp. FCG-A23 TaxID=3080561 RepID=UPI0029558227|nr:HAD-IIIA family hydrolase [Terasakiella sp. A23]MDV7339257.1 HAD-IIIA family hydrolase [Terasakiella sp. A23]